MLLLGASRNNSSYWHASLPNETASSPQAIRDHAVNKFREKAAVNLACPAAIGRPSPRSRPPGVLRFRASRVLQTGLAISFKTLWPSNVSKWGYWSALAYGSQPIE